jgi:hypothetical protein
MPRVRKDLLLIGALLALLAGLTAPDSSAAGSRLVVRVDEPFEVNGRLFPAGELSLREVAAFSPVITLNEVCVENECLGLLLAQERSDASVAPCDEMVFRRDGRGHLVLESVAIEGRPALDFYSFDERAGGQWQLPAARL